MQNWGENAPVSAFLHSSQSIFAFFTKHSCILHKAFLLPSQNIFASFTKHFCKLKHYHLRIVNMAFAMRNHGICEA